MSDYISRQAAIDAAIDAADDWDGGYSLSRRADMIERAINNLPSAQPEIIRCGDCEHYKFADDRAFGFPVKHCEVTGFEDVEDDDFCSRAERRQDG